jgi:hypothetical protein
MADIGCSNLVVVDGIRECTNDAAPCGVCCFGCAFFAWCDDTGCPGTRRAQAAGLAIRPLTVAESALRASLAV